MTALAREKITCTEISRGIVGVDDRVYWSCRHQCPAMKVVNIYVVNRSVFAFTLEATVGIVTRA